MSQSTLNTTGWSGASGYSGAASMVCEKELISQGSHPFSPGQVAYRRTSDSTFQLAQANTDATAEAVGVIESVPNSGQFWIVYHGRITCTTGQGWTDGSTYFLSPSVAGALTATEPTSVGSISKPVLVATGASTGIVLNYRGIVVDDSGGFYNINETITYANTFTAGQVVYRKSDSTWQLAKADNEDTAESLGVVQTSDGASFNVVYKGKIIGLAGLTDGGVYYLSDSSAGSLTTTEPTTIGSISKPVLVATSSTTGVVVNYRGSQIAPSPSGRNALINGNMEFWQRGTSITLSTNVAQNAAQSYNADRFFCRSAGAAVTSVARNATVPDINSRYSALITGNTSVTTVDFGQRIEASTVGQKLRRTITFSCMLYNNTGGAFTPLIKMATPDAADLWTGTVTNRLSASLQSCANTAWTKLYYTVDISGYTNLVNGLEVTVQIPTGNMNTNGDQVMFAQMQLEPGATYTDFEVVDPGLELYRCERYFQVFGGDQSNEPLGHGIVSAATTTMSQFVLKQHMRTVPTVSNSAWTDFQVFDGSIGSQCTNGTLSIANQASRSVVRVDFTHGTLTAYRPAWIYAYNTNCRLYCIAEL